MARLGAGSTGYYNPVEINIIIESSQKCGNLSSLVFSSLVAARADVSASLLFNTF